jgi:mRNA interferase MazF
MTSYRPGDLILVAFPQADGTPGKLRPALVFADTGDSDVIVARVTTQSHPSKFDLTITKWKQAGLLALSYVRLHKLATLEKSLVSRKLGELAVEDRRSVTAILTQLLEDW